MKPEDMEMAEEKELAGALGEYRKAAHEATRRPEGFWQRQRLAINARIGSRRLQWRMRPVLALGMAAVVVLIVISLKIQGPRALPAPDFACGYDQELLYDVDRLLSTPVPSALDPAMVLVSDMSAGAGTPVSSGRK